MRSDKKIIQLPMLTLSDKEFANFLKESPLYSKIQLLNILPPDIQFDILEFFEEKAYKFYCPIEKDYHTFKIDKNYGHRYVLYVPEIRHYLNRDRKLDFSFYIRGICQSCQFRMDILLNLLTEIPFKSDETFPPIFLKKIGQLPPFERSPEKEVLDYLTDEDQENYKKALSNLAVSYGIGAFAYFRRIIENEIKRIVKDISQLEFENVDKVRKAWTEYEQNHQMTTLIENIYQYLPKSLKEIGDNPIKLLHQQLSGGIHEFSEDECLDKAKKVDILLRYVIKKVNSEKFELIEVRKAMKGLKGND